ncbi:UbiH/UbiF/VisC/COQ6 family ubiquinone biosynthesis hydroxylase [Temperatibacter marinus]|uniref:UbiH/UbiF/VisC/COQ6 family ubiquinone biosynthesis hydroxylase n=1 Tax=Temperatibacter marinus TaxID=1456591 RepID=A0AA52EJE3_9PROT|nr:UbiH/UbiF/VisC/COQ6 family ubiquinone biosynthesis hydroxylase [Temperatibacter marinus]WND03627.1 UbiH/UbiF/VisC/COQ6 family ubiquinone biosynthesis hydroxylase [Temperatibacter marinus]
MHVVSSDIIILGGGLVGLTTAIGLEQAGFSVTVVDHLPKGEFELSAFDGRSSALAYAPCQLLDVLGIWDYIKDHAQPILEIRVTDGRRPSLMHLHFDNEELGDGPLGHLVENRHTRLALMKRLEACENVTWLDGQSVKNIERDTGRVTLELETGSLVTGALLVGADGRHSMVRKWAEFPLTHWSYQQSGIVCTIEHEESHCGIAHEKFLPSGPFAILPLTGNRSSIVWSEKTHLVDTVMGLSDRAFESELQRRVGDFLGKVSVIGGRWAYPLQLHWCDHFVDNRVTLIGDACHGMHPIAGQGLNLGLRDVAALVEVLTKNARSGMDIGSLTVLEEYQMWRRMDNAMLLSVTDGLTHLFSNDHSIIKQARTAGLALVNEIPMAKKFFMSHARGTIGELPELLKGNRP